MWRVLVFAVLLSAYIAIGAPLAGYIPGLQELTILPKQEVPLTKAQIERMEREALRKEQEEEYEKTLMEDKIKEAEKQAKQDKIDKARREKEEAENAKTSAMSSYTARIQEATERIGDEPSDGVMLRLRCPDGLQLTRKFSPESLVSAIYDYVDVERHKKASRVSSLANGMLPSIALALLSSLLFARVLPRNQDLSQVDDRGRECDARGVFPAVRAEGRAPVHSGDGVEGSARGR